MKQFATSSKNKKNYTSGKNNAFQRRLDDSPDREGERRKRAFRHQKLMQGGTRGDGAIVPDS